MAKIYGIILIWGVSGGGVTCSTLHLCLLFMKTEKVQEHDLYLNQILHHFDLQAGEKPSQKVREPDFQKRTIKYINFTYNVIF